MSIVTLKRKTDAINSNVSKNGFYLQGTLRQPPHNLIRTPTYTRMKGTAPHGYGTGSNCRITEIPRARACKNAYPIYIQQDIYNTLQTVPNKSTYSNFAMLDQRFRKYIFSPIAVAVLPPSMSSSEQTTALVENTMKCVPLVGSGSTTSCPTATAKNAKNSCQTTKNTNKYVIDYATYMLKFSAQCNLPELPKKVWHTNTIIGAPAPYLINF
jgi:hypothetical protein